MLFVCFAGEKNAEALECYDNYISSDTLSLPVTNVFTEGEELNYEGYYNWGMIWVKAGKVNFTTRRLRYRGRDSYHVRAVGVSCSGWDWFFKLRDTFEVYNDAEKLVPLSFSRIVNEGARSARYDYDFDYLTNTIYSNVKIGKKVEYSGIQEFTPGVMDMLSFAWYVRNLDYSKYSKGEKIKVPLIISNKVYDLYVRYKGIETIETRGGTEIECHKFSPMLIKGSMFRGGEDMTVWVSNDANRVPIMAEAKVIIGSVKGILSSYKGLKYKTEIFPAAQGKTE